jgi:hypothetical protein
MKLNNCYRMFLKHNIHLQEVMQRRSAENASRFSTPSRIQLLENFISEVDRLCGLVVRVPGYRSRGPDSISGATRFSEK